MSFYTKAHPPHIKKKKHEFFGNFKNISFVCNYLPTEEWSVDVGSVSSL